MVVYQYVCQCDHRYAVELPKDCKIELVNTFQAAQGVTKDQQKVCLIMIANSLALLVSSVILQLDII